MTLTQTGPDSAGTQAISSHFKTNRTSLKKRATKCNWDKKLEGKSYLSFFYMGCNTMHV